MNALQTPTTRVASIDLIRGAVMILMAIDHVRVYAGVPAGGPTAGVFFTRWITHFCAPAFIFFAGTSAFFYARKHADLSRFLVARGLWLIVLELSVLRWAWTFNGQFLEWQMAGVIWVIGWSMIAMALLVKLPLRIVAAIGIIIIAGHNLFDAFIGERIDVAASSGLSWLWKILYLSFYAGPIQVGGEGHYLMVLYSLIPWVGVMAAGYAFGKVLTLDPRGVTASVWLWESARVHSFWFSADSTSTAIRGRGAASPPATGERRRRCCSTSSTPRSIPRRCRSCS